MSITTLPAAPSKLTDTPTSFSIKMDAVLAALAQFVADVNSTESNMVAQAGIALAQAAIAAAQASNSAASASAAANSLAAAQGAIGASKWVAGAYGAGVCAWSPTNGLLYRTRAAIASSTTDPLNDPSNWYSLALQGLPIGYVTDTGGSMYGLSNGGLNSINVITYSGGACLKYLPQSPNNGDECVILVANGRVDNAIFVNAANPVPVVFGTTTVTDLIVLDKISDALTLKYFSALNQWRKV